MKTIICDASPLIFLAKLDLLHLISEALEGKVMVLECVRDEVCSESAGDVEMIRLRRFFDQVEIVDFRNAAFPSVTLSESDRSTLNWAIENRSDWLVADERLLRRVASEHGIPVVGLFGILIQAMRKGIATKEETRSAVNEVVSVHECRISVSLYQRILEEIDHWNP